MLLVIITMLSLWSVCRYQLREAWEMKHERMIITTAISMWEREDHINASRLF